MNTYFLGNHFLFHSGLIKGLNLIPWVQTDLSVFI